MINYTASQIREIAEIGENQHIGLLTDCGIHNDYARKMIKLTGAELTAAIAQFEPVPNKTAMQAGLVEAAKRELIIRQA